MNLTAHCWSPVAPNLQGMLPMNWGNCNASIDPAIVANEVVTHAKVNPNGMAFLWGLNSPPWTPDLVRGIYSAWKAVGYKPSGVVIDSEGTTATGAVGNLAVQTRAAARITKALVVDPLNDVWPDDQIPVCGTGLFPLAEPYFDKNNNEFSVVAQRSYSPSNISSPQMYAEGGSYYSRPSKLTCGPVDWNTCVKNAGDILNFTANGTQGARLKAWLAPVSYSNNGHQTNVRTYQLRCALAFMVACGCVDVLYWNAGATAQDNVIFAESLAWANQVVKRGVIPALPAWDQTSLTLTAANGSPLVFAYDGGAGQLSFAAAAGADVAGTFIY